jgi:hypothetical protein
MATERDPLSYRSVVAQESLLIAEFCVLNDDPGNQQSAISNQHFRRQIR